MPTAPEMCSSHSHGFGLRPLMFAQRHIFFRLRAFISGCLAALTNSHLQLCCLVDMVLGTGKPAPPFPARVMPMEIGISFSCPKKTLRLSLLRTLAWPRASPDECSLSGQAFAVAFLGHNNSQRHSIGHADFFDFLFKILQLSLDGYSTITQRTEKP